MPALRWHYIACYNVNCFANLIEQCIMYYNWNIGSFDDKWALLICWQEYKFVMRVEYLCSLTDTISCKYGKWMTALGTEQFEQMNMDGNGYIAVEGCIR